MSFLSRASLHHPPPPSHASSSTAVENGIKTLPTTPFEPIEKKSSRKSKRKPAKSEDKIQDDPKRRSEASWQDDTTAVASPADDAAPSTAGQKGAGEDKTRFIGRVSSIFKAKRKVPENLNLGEKTAPSAWSNRKAIGTMYIAEEGRGGSYAYDSDMDTCDESIDDIRRPSGLGSAVSLMVPPSPSWPLTGPTGSAADEDAKPPAEDATYSRSRSTSTPSRIRSMTRKAKDKLRKGVKIARKASQSSQGHSQENVEISGTFTSLPPVPKPVSMPQFPAEVLDLVFSHLPRATIAGLCTLSRTYCAAGRARLYNRLDLDSLPPAKLQRLLATLASKRELPELVHECVCHTWPNFFSKPQDGEVDEETQLRNTLLTATFTLAFQRMSNLVQLTLPAFDASLLAQHTAFGLRSLTFMCDRMTNEETSALFTWLDGQTNVVELKFPNLEDTASSSGNPDGPAYLMPPSDAVTSPLSPRFSPFLRALPSPNGPESVRSTSPSPSAAGLRRSLFVSQTLLPALKTLHATPAVLSLLQPASYIPNNVSNLDLTTSPGPSSPAASITDTTPRRRLSNVRLNVDTTLYTGLRPNAVMANLKSAGVKVLGIRFGETVDKRTVEKCLSAVGAILGTNEKAKGDKLEEDGGDDEEWKGLEELEVSFKATSTLMPGIEETLYKTIQSSLPRYSRLRKLVLKFHRPPPDPSTSGTSPTLLLSPAPRSLSAPEDWEVSLKLKGEKSIENLNVFKFPVPPPSVPVTPNLNRLSAAFSNGSPTTPSSRVSIALSNPGSNGTKRASPPIPLPLITVYPAKDGVDVEEGDLERWNEKDWGRVQAWAKACPSLRRVDFAGVAWECRSPPVPPIELPDVAERRKSDASPAKEVVPVPESKVLEEPKDIEQSSPPPVAPPAPTHKPMPSLPPPPLPPKDRQILTPSPRAPSPTASAYGPTIHPIPSPHLVPPVHRSPSPNPHPQPAPDWQQQPQVVSVFPVSPTSVPFPAQSRSPVRTVSVPSRAPHLPHLPPQRAFSGSNTDYARPKTGGSASSPRQVHTREVRPATSGSGSKKSSSIRSDSSNGTLQDAEAAAKERKRLESMRILAKINARDQRWVPKDAEDEDDEDEGEEEEEGTIQEAVYGALRKPFLHSEPRTPPRLDVNYPVEMNGGHNYGMSFSSRVATEGSMSTDFGNNFTSRYGDGYHEPDDVVEDGQSAEFAYASARRDDHERDGGVGAGSLRLTRYIESDSDESETEESIGAHWG